MKSMTLSAAFHLAIRYVARHRLQTLLLAAALGLVLALPLSIRVLATAAEAAMRARADATPQVLGARGSAVDLLLTSLYFKRQALPAVPAKALSEIRDTSLGEAIPLYIRFHAQQAPIVGTELEYFSFRRLHMAQGRAFARLGDCVVGSRLAAQRHLSPGSHVFSSQEQVFDIAGIYPLKLRVTGILTPSGTPDDDAIFADLKTIWLIQGLGHGHDDLAKDPEATLKKEKDNTVANASVRLYNEVTDANVSSFHFHGNTDEFPLSAVIIIPQDAKSEALLAGRYLRTDTPFQLIRPSDEFATLISTLFQVQNMVLGVLALTAVSALTVAALVFALSFRLRQKQFETLSELGVSGPSLLLTKAIEIATVGVGGLLIALSLTVIVDLNAASWVRLLLA